MSEVQVAPATGSVRIGGTIQLTATPKTASGIVLFGRSVAWSSSNPEIATVSATGLVQAVAVGGPVRITARVDDVAGDAIITVLALPVARVTVAPSQAAIPLGSSTQLSAAAYDGVGQVMPGVTFSWLSSNPAIADVTTTGIVLAIGEGGPVTITATADGVSGSARISVFRPAPIAPVATRLGFTQEPSPSTAGQPITPAVRVAIQDEQGVVVAGSSARVTIGLGNNSGGATLTGTLAVDAVNGVATFGDLVVDRAGTYTLVASASGLAAATSAPFSVAAPAPPSLTITVQPSNSAQMGVVFAQQPVVGLRTGSGQPISGVAVTAAIESGSGSLNGITTVVSDGDGLATYSNLSIGGAQGTHTLRFDASGFPSASSNPIVVSAGSVSQLSFTQQPGSSATSGQAFAQQPILVLRDASNNPISGQVVTATVTGSPAGVSLIGTTSVTTDASGTASFVGSGLGLSGPSGTYTLTFQAGTVTSPASAPISLNGGAAPARVTYTQQPGSTAQSGQPFSQQPILLVEDAGNNPVSGQVVTVSITGSPAGATLVGATAVTTDASGAASFVGSGLGISGPVGSYTLTFQAGSATSAASNSITLSAGPASQLTITVQPSTLAARNVPFLQQPVIQLRDGAGNPVNQAGVPVTAAIASGPSNGSLGGTTTIPTDSSGAASFMDLKINKSGTYTLIFQSGNLQPVTSDPITVP